MGFLRRDRQGREPVEVATEGSQISTYTDVGEFSEACAVDGRGALRLPHHYGAGLLGRARYR